MKIMDFLKPPRTSSRASLGLLIIRVVAGLAFMHHGYGKIQHPFSWMGADSGTPGVMQALAAVSEFCGGLGWILGLLTPVAAFGIACTMAVAVHFHAFVRHDPFVSQTGGTSFEPAAGYLAVAVLLLLAGPGRYSIDRLIFREKG